MGKSVHQLDQFTCFVDKRNWNGRSVVKKQNRIDSTVEQE